MLKGNARYQHPYLVEIEKYSYPSEMFSTAEPIPYLPFATTTATFVDTMDGVKNMLEELEAAKEIAIDLEHHDTYSYIGIVSLMQISTRGKDWIVDTLKPWREELQILNAVFANPAILKVLHGSASDIVWLQRDLGLYIVGLFDTFHACRVLKHPKKSLKTLLERYVNFNAQKKYQMADWRTRPLPTPMFEYARSDTHFLLYIYDNLRNEINQLPAAACSEEHPLRDVLRSSKEESLQTYTRMIYDVERGTGTGGWASSLRSTPSLLSGEQLAVYKAVHKWRDLQARKEDTNPAIVMGRDVIFSIARALPDNVHALLGSHQPFPTNLRPRANELLDIIRKAMVEDKNPPNIEELSRPKMLFQARSEGAETQPLVPKLKDQTGQTANRTKDDVNGGPITHESRLWGETLNEDVIPASFNDPACRSNHRLFIPLPSSKMLSEESLAAIAIADRNDRKDLTGPMEPSPVNENQIQGQEEIFVAKDHGSSKRPKLNRMHSNVGMSLDIDTDARSNGSRSALYKLEEFPHDIDQVSKQQPREQREQERRARKVEPHEAPTSSKAVDEEITPFDYMKTPSLLRAVSSSKPPTGLKRPMNPYIKSLDAPQGMRKLQREKPGKSFTFKD